MHGNEGHQSENGCGQEGNCLVRREHGRDRIDQDKHQSDFHCGHVGEFVDRPLDRGDPVHFLVVVEEEGQPDHRQESAAKAGDADMRFGHDALYSAGLLSDNDTASTGPTCAAIATMAMGKTIRIPKTAINIPIVRKRCCQTGSISRSTVA